MILADTSVWINHFIRTDNDLIELMQKEALVMHPLVLVELACGNLRNRETRLSDLNLLPSVEAVSERETLVFLEKYSLFGKGLGFVDINLMATCKKHKIFLYTYEKALRRESIKQGVYGFRP